jgi:hypothetical protein
MDVPSVWDTEFALLAFTAYEPILFYPSVGICLETGYMWFSSTLQVIDGEVP